MLCVGTHVYTQVKKLLPFSELMRFCEPFDKRQEKKRILGSNSPIHLSQMCYKVCQRKKLY